jgi:hypothetical protein
MSPFLPESIRLLFADALTKVPRPLDRDVIAWTFRVIERDPLLRARYLSECTTYGSAGTVNKFGGMAVRELLGWDKESGNPRPALRFTSLLKTYTRLIPLASETSASDLDSLAPAYEPEADALLDDDLTQFPEIQDWVTLTQAADMLGITRASVHKKVIQRDFKSTHRLGDRPHLVLLRNEVEDMKAARESATRTVGEITGISNIVRVNVGASGKTTTEEFLSRCSDEDHEYYEHLFRALSEAGLKFWMGEKGFSISRIIWGYPTHECRRRGLYLQMEQVPKRNLDAVRRVLAADAGLDVDSLRSGQNPRFTPEQLPAKTVVRIVETALGRE